MTVYLEIGPPASGKSTHARSFAERERAVRLSADEIRGIVGTGEDDQSVSYIAFKNLETAAEILLRQNFNLVIDNLNKDRKSRKRIVELARKYNARLVAFIHQPPLEVCIERNRSRERQVPEEFLIQIYNEIQIPLPGVEVDETLKIS
jgi:protein phosphatase